ncbi:ergot alkaloid biosynthesis protein [bacterium]|nr:MAG: ergot alkaloid biosynthesis protein [bacterium]
MRDQILITGGGGKTGSRLAANLRQRAAKFRIAQRSPQGEGNVRFDWLDASTYEAALVDVRAAYLVAPSNVPDPLIAMRPFLERAIESGVERFVLLSASILEEGGPMMGEVHAFLKRHAPQWVALRPTWFMQNFSEGQHLPTIRDESAIYSATGDGRVPFIDASDIAAVAAEALTAPDFASRDIVLTGPQLLSYAEVAQILSATIGRPIVQRRLSESELAAWFGAQGIESQYAQVLAAMDTAIANGGEERLTSEVLDITGYAPTSFADFVRASRDVWSN